MLEIKPWLETTGYVVEEDLFMKPPSLPYIIFKENNDVSGADDKNCIVDRKISIELYSEEINKVAEKAIETLLNEKTIQYSKNRIWLNTEMMFETIYDFNLIEKF
jgi:hypothetical protein